MPDDVWCDDINGQRLEALVYGTDDKRFPSKAAQKRFRAWVKDFVIPHYDLLAALQDAHDFAIMKKDGTFKKSSITRALKAVAKDFNLKAEF
jgi:hypothetical protein